MAVKRLEINGIGPVEFQKRRGAKHIRIRIDGSNVKVTLPFWSSYSLAVAYVTKKEQWIKEHRQTPLTLKHGDRIGKYHTLTLKPSTTKSIRSKVDNEAVTLTLPAHLAITDHFVQEKLNHAATKALKEQSELLIPDRLSELAKQHGFSFYDLRFKKLKGRWGSCSKEAVITLNIYLIQLPWHLIDYVLLHELTHTEHFDHSPAFWQRLESCLPSAKKLRTEMRQYSPTIIVK